MASSTHASTPLRSRAVELLKSFFAADDERSRRAVLNAAFDGCSPNPAQDLNASGPLATFAADAVDKLLSYGAVGRGKHALAVLIEHLAGVRGRQTNPDYADLPAILNQDYALPTRAEQRVYLSRLIDDVEEKARIYSPLAGVLTKQRDPAAAPLAGLLPDDIQQVLLRYQPRAAEKTAPLPLPARDYDDILSAFAQIKHAALLGGPGSGKSTTLRRLAVDLAQRAVAEGNTPLPVLAPLGDWIGDEPLIEFLARHCSEIGWAIEVLAAQGKLILLLDGLNEMPTAKRGAKSSEIKATCNKFKKLHAQNAIFASCRREDYVGDLDLGLETLTLEPLSSQRIQKALKQWVALGNEPPETAARIFWQLAGDERLEGVYFRWLEKRFDEERFWQGEERSDDRIWRELGWDDWALWRHHLSNPRSLLKLASNPFMLAMLFSVWLQRRQLPQNRGDLFRRFVDTLLIRERLYGTADGDRLLKGLAELAWRMQRERIARREAESAEDFSVLTVVSLEATLDCLGSDFLLKKALDGTLLEGVEQFRFRHQLLQEYFTARALLAERSSLSASELWPLQRWWERSGWEESVVLLAGFFEEDCGEVIRWVGEAQPEVAAQCIEQSGAEVANKDALLHEFQSAWLPRLTDIQLEPSPEARAAVGRALARLNLDNRHGVSVRQADSLPDIDWVQIEGGKFIYQQGERRMLETFRIARYPITNSQWQAFLNASDGYANDRWWEGLTNPDRQPEKSTWIESNHPVTDVSWFEAVAFCRWLTAKLGLPVRLPTEWEWERAARGRNGREYPWEGGYREGFANVDETGLNAGPHYLGRTSPVGMYPQGCSEDGVYDLAGNVWEWCLNEYSKPNRCQVEGESARVLRGGSWLYNRGLARSEFRLNLQPHSRNNNCGFRVVVSSPIQERWLRKR